MWTPATRGRMAKIEKKTKRYPSDLTDEEWARIEPFLPGASKAGRPIEVDLREVLNAIRYMARSGGGCEARSGVIGVGVIHTAICFCETDQPAIVSCRRSLRRRSMVSIRSNLRSRWTS